MDRRQLIGAGLTLAATPAFAASPSSLGELAAAKGIRFGSATGIKTGGLTNPKVAGILTRECRILVARNEMKMYTIRNAPPKVYDFGPGDAVLAFAETHKMPLRGHTLFWAKDEFLPKWLLTHDFGSNPKLGAERMLRDYIGTVASHYGARLTSWDVINEAIDEKTGDIRANVFTRILGRDALRICFEAAREHLPKIELVYNDYMSWRPKDAIHRKAALDLLRWFRDIKLPVDALGIQGHIGTDQSVTSQMTSDDTTPQYAEWTRFLDDAAALGFTLMVTEFDFNDRKVEGDIARRDAVVAEVARTYIDLTLANTAVKDFLCWGLDDRYSWLQSTRPRTDGLPLRPTPYDEAFKPKPLREAMAVAFRSAPNRA